jgi:hypothetical protein
MYSVSSRACRQSLAAVQRHGSSVTRSYHHGRPLYSNAWVEVVEQNFDPQTKAWKFEDPETTVSRIHQQVGSKGRTIRVSKRTRHTNPSTYKKELNNKIAYERKKNQVMDLIKYIHFVKDHKNKDNW